MFVDFIACPIKDICVAPTVDIFFLSNYVLSLLYDICRQMVTDVVLNTAPGINISYIGENYIN